MQDSSENTEPKQNTNDTQENWRERFDQLQSSFDRLSSELDTVRENVQKRKRETVTLKILLYTGLFLLMIGFIYSNTTLQRVQLQNLDADFLALTTQTNRDFSSMQGIIISEMQKLKNKIVRTSTPKRDKNSLNRQEIVLQNTLINAENAVSQLPLASTQTQKLIEQFSQASSTLIQSFAQYKNKLTAPTQAEKSEEKETPSAE